MSLAEELSRSGVVTFPIFTGFNLQQVQSEIETALTEFKEVSDHEAYSEKPALAIFGAIATPSSFHHPVIRRIRLTAAEEIRKRFPSFHSSNGMELSKMQMLFDRLGVRVPTSKEWGGGKISGESWHRDQAPEEIMEPGDQILGGWVNLNLDVVQRFVCIPETHQRAEGSGFLRSFTAEEKKNFNQTKVTIEVPPGHAILFFQHIIHKVLSYTIEKREVRLFLGVRFTNSDTSLFDYEKAIRGQGVPPLPSGQIPRLYERMHLVHWRDKIKKWTESFIPEMKDDQYKVGLPPVSKSLRQLSEESGENLMWPEYKEYDKAILRPFKIN